jgi:hypothetical protein
LDMLLAVVLVSRIAHSQCSKREANVIATCSNACSNTGKSLWTTRAQDGQFARDLSTGWTVTDGGGQAPPNLSTGIAHFWTSPSVRFKLK